MEKVERGSANDLVRAGGAQELEPCRVHEDNPVLLGDKDGIRRHFHEPPVPFFTFPERLLRPLTLLDVSEQGRFLMCQLARGLIRDPVEDCQDQQDRDLQEMALAERVHLGQLHIEDHPVRAAQENRQSDHLFERRGKCRDQHDQEVGDIEIRAGLTRQIDDGSRHQRVAHDQGAREPLGRPDVSRQQGQADDGADESQGNELNGSTWQQGSSAEQQLIREHDRDEAMQEDKVVAIGSPCGG